MKFVSRFLLLFYVVLFVQTWGDAQIEVIKPNEERKKESSDFEYDPSLEQKFNRFRELRSSMHRKKRRRKALQKTGLLTVGVGLLAVFLRYTFKALLPNRVVRPIIDERWNDSIFSPQQDPFGNRCGIFALANYLTVNKVIIQPCQKEFLVDGMPEINTFNKDQTNFMDLATHNVNCLLKLFPFFITKKIENYKNDLAFNIDSKSIDKLINELKASISAAKTKKDIIQAIWVWRNINKLKRITLFPKRLRENIDLVNWNDNYNVFVENAEVPVNFNFITDDIEKLRAACETYLYPDLEQQMKKFVSDDNALINYLNGQGRRDFINDDYLNQFFNEFLVTNKFISSEVRPPCILNDRLSQPVPIMLPVMLEALSTIISTNIEDKWEQIWDKFCAHLVDLGDAKISVKDIFEGKCHVTGIWRSAAQMFRNLIQNGSFSCILNQDQMHYVLLDVDKDRAGAQIIIRDSMAHHGLGYTTTLIMESLQKILAKWSPEVSTTIID